MADLIAELRELCAIEGRPLTVGERARTKIAMSEAAAALEAAREDAGKWAILSMRRGDWPELDIAMEDAEAAIDQARGKGGGEVEGG